MYIDFIKTNYTDLPENERKQYIERDKKALVQIIREKVAHDAENIVERLYKLDDIGILPQQEKFLDLLKEAEQLFAFGFYTGTIAIVGIACEEYCRYMISLHNLTDVKTQDMRIEKLRKSNVITESIGDALHKVRKYRNECMHYNSPFKNLNEEELEKHAYYMLEQYKSFLAPLAYETNKLNNEQVIASFAKERGVHLREYIYKYRNILKNTQNINLQLPPGVSIKAKKSVYYVAEIDISELFREMTLIDLRRLNVPVVVDLTLPQCDSIKSLKLEEGNLITGTLISQVSTMGQTEEWLLLDISDVSSIVYDLEEIFSFNYEEDEFWR